MDYTTLVAAKTTEGSIKNMINFSDLPVEVILTNAQSLMFSFLRVREMKERTTDSFTTGDTTDTLPTGFLEPVGNQIEFTGEWQGSSIVILPEEEYEQSRIYDPDNLTLLLETTPTACALTGTQILLNARCDQTYNYALWHYKSPTVLSSTNTTNWVTNRYPHVLTNFLRHFAFKHRQSDQRAVAELKEGMAYIEQINREHDYVKASYTYSHHWER
jgi:hypothetical protein